MFVTVFDKIIDVPDESVRIYEELMNEPFTDLTAQYLAGSCECTADMSEEELVDEIEQNIAEHVSIYGEAVEAMANPTKELSLC